MFARGDTPLFRSRDIPSILRDVMSFVVLPVVLSALASLIAVAKLFVSAHGPCPQRPSFAATQQASFTPPLKDNSNAMAVLPVGRRLQRRGVRRRDCSRLRASRSHSGGPTESVQSSNHAREIAHLSPAPGMNELAGSIAHELNQPLTAITSNAQAARSIWHRGHATPPRCGDPDDIVADASRASEIVRRVRALILGEALRRFTSMSARS
jgi:signal transduction histidine kinase